MTIHTPVTHMEELDGNPWLRFSIPIHFSQSGSKPEEDSQLALSLSSRASQIKNKLITMLYCGFCHLVHYWELKMLLYIQSDLWAH